MSKEKKSALSPRPADTAQKPLTMQEKLLLIQEWNETLQTGIKPDGTRLTPEDRMAMARMKALLLRF